MYIVERFYVISEAETLLYNKQTSCLLANMSYNQRRSIISAHVLIIDAKINTCVKGYYYIDWNYRTFSVI